MKVLAQIKEHKVLCMGSPLCAEAIMDVISEIRFYSAVSTR
jgi:hypothetical protein